VARWIESLGDVLAIAPAFCDHALRSAARDDENFLFALHRDAMRDYIDAIWGWNEEWQRAHFAAEYAPARNAVIVCTRDTPRDIGRISLTRHWRTIFLRDIELAADVRNRGLGTAIVCGVLRMARERGRCVELRVLHGNPARRLYARLGFTVIADDGARLRMRAQ